MGRPTGRENKHSHDQHAHMAELSRGLRFVLVLALPLLGVSIDSALGASTERVHVAFVGSHYFGRAELDSQAQLPVADCGIQGAVLLQWVQQVDPQPAV